MVPTFAPIITPTACRRLIIPEFTNPTTITVVAEDSASFLVRLCKPASFSPILAVTGVGLLLFSRRDRLKNVAVILVGFGILMLHRLERIARQPLQNPFKASAGKFCQPLPQHVHSIQIFLSGELVEAGPAKTLFKVPRLCCCPPESPAACACSLSFTSSSTAACARAASTILLLRLAVRERK